MIKKTITRAVKQETKKAQKSFASRRKPSNVVVVNISKKTM